MRRLPLVLLSAARGAGAVAAPASADVLVSAFPGPLVCGDPIVPGIWAQPGTTKVVYKGDGFTARYTIRFRSEGA